jgi:uncharacterized protein YgbK (DUF1537 family)
MSSLPAAPSPALTGWPQPLPLDELAARFPPPWPDPDVLDRLRRELSLTDGVASGRTPLLCVLDDDPMGSQTLHGVVSYLRWDGPVLRRAAQASDRLILVVTGGRSRPARGAALVTARAAQAVLAGAAEAGRAVEFVMRGDSTLRGHFAAESDALARVLARAGRPPHGLLLVPFFAEGGRVTALDVQWVVEGTMAVPVHLTAYARDAAFPFTAATLPAWVAEHWGRRLGGRPVITLDLADLRQRGPDWVADRLVAAPRRAIVIANALSYADLAVVVAGEREAARRGVAYLVRGAASFVKLRGGVPDRPLLGRADLVDRASPRGLVLVGSHVPRTTEQLERLLAHSWARGICLDVSSVAASVPVVTTAPETLRQALAAVRAAWAAGCLPVVYTSRAEIQGADPAEDARIKRAIGGLLVALARAALRSAGGVDYLLIKGGTTAYEVATRACGAASVDVLGQVAPGVPAWRVRAPARFAGLLLIAFPGNVGGPDTLVEVLERVRSP